MTNLRKAVLRAAVSPLAVLHELPQAQAFRPDEPPRGDLEFARGEDGKVRITRGAADITDEAATIFANNLERVARARDKRIRKAQKRAQSNG